MFDFSLESPKSTMTIDDSLQYDFLVIGGGPAGLNAALYAKRKGLTVGLITKDIGGQLHNTTTIENYLGFQQLEGKDLSAKFHQHLKQLNVPVISDAEVIQVEKDGENFRIHLEQGRDIQAKTVLVATGGKPRHLEIPGEMEFANKGVSYCTICDAPFFKDKRVIVAGGGNGAADAVLDLVPYASEIIVVHRSQWRADKILLDKLDKLPNLSVHLDTQILEVIGDSHLKGIRVMDKPIQQTRIIATDGLFIHIGTEPNSHLVKHLVQFNERQEIIVDAHQMTSLPGLFAAGDVTNQPYKQIIISAAEGANAALSASHYLTHQYKGE